MTIIKENHLLTRIPEEWRAVRPDRLWRGRVVKFFSKEAPDRKGKFGYGFLKTESGSRQFFCMSRAASVEVSEKLPVPALLFVPGHCLESPIGEPKVGDFLWYSLRERPCGCRQEANPWVYERDYEAAKQELAAR